MINEKYWKAFVPLDKDAQGDLCEAVAIDEAGDFFIGQLFRDGPNLFVDQHCWMTREEAERIRDILTLLLGKGGDDAR